MVSGDPVRNDDGRASGGRGQPAPRRWAAAITYPCSASGIRAGRAVTATATGGDSDQALPCLTVARWSGLLKVAKAAPQTRPAPLDMRAV
jgi:hypothetical protein